MARHGNTSLVDPVSVPIILGYFPVAFAFGVTAGALHIPGWASLLMSVAIYAGASQFLLIHLAGGAVPAVAVMSVLFLNSRMALEGFSFFKRVDWPRRERLAAMLLTDEVFVTASLSRPSGAGPFLRLAVWPYLSWIAGTALGVLAGGYLPHLLTLALGVGLYALFAALLVAAVQEDLRLIMAAGLGALVSWLGSGPMGEWSLAVAMVLAPLLFAALPFRERPLREGP